jgi:hypothetical protein
MPCVTLAAGMYPHAHPWLRVQLAIRAMMSTRWGAPAVKAELGEGREAPRGSPQGAVVELGSVIARRRFLLTLSGGILAAPLVAEAQRAGRVPTIGVLATTQLTDAVRQAIRDRLREHGYVEGQNVLIEWRAAEGLSDRAAALAPNWLASKSTSLSPSKRPRCRRRNTRRVRFRSSWRRLGTQ